ncbi:hypothetical protein PMIN01_04780 [Paraphaeosphaeria minitans]|uniref:Uncharacterized protein n=1 Tax=Paraphaeosphaeria minitans TaxID=565426 RepID=A0A9P6GJW4_9PLEO|nr:hypothetical protein PMIN01_04780 [Paraphaeosphaeria minitans]
MGLKPSRLPVVKLPHLLQCCLIARQKLEKPHQIKLARCLGHFYLRHIAGAAAHYPTHTYPTYAVPPAEVTFQTLQPRDDSPTS